MESEERWTQAGGALAAASWLDGWLLSGAGLSGGWLAPEPEAPEDVDLWVVHGACGEGGGKGRGAGSRRCCRWRAEWLGAQKGEGQPCRHPCWINIASDTQLAARTCCCGWPDEPPAALKVEQPLVEEPPLSPPPACTQSRESR